MSAQEELVAAVEAAWAAFREQVDGVDWTTPVYTDPVWTARDVLAHCAFSMNDAVRVLEAHRAGGVYVVDTGDRSYADILDERNQQGVDATRALSDHDLIARWIAGQDAFTEALRAFDDTDMAREIACPWRDPTSVADWVRGDLAHEGGHIADVVAAARTHGGAA